MSALTPLRLWWISRPPRERRMLRLGLAVVGVYLLWSLLWQPSWTVLRNAPAQRAQAINLLQSLHQLRAQAEHWQQQAPLTRADRDAALQSLARSAGWSLQPQARAWRLTLQDWSAEQLSQALHDIAQDAHAVVAQTQLQQTAGRWNGWMHIETEPQP